LKLLAEHRDEAIRSRAAKLLAGSQTSKRADIVAAYKGTLEMQGDAAREAGLRQDLCRLPQGARRLTRLDRI
jgi:hypothetical protein